LILITDGISFLYDMPKFYILSGQLKYIVDSNSHESAIFFAIEYAREYMISLGSKICISEKGFKDRKNCYNTDEYIKREI
jgi:hypothetical protein